jgi:branched-chain amino acid transport system substrate-binding protein
MHMLWKSGLAASLIATTLGVCAASAEVGVTDTTIKIGTFGAMTGPYYTYGKVVMDGAQVIFNEVNAKGGIHGRKIEYIREDDRCDAAAAITAAKKLIFEHQVFMLNAGGCSNPSVAARPEVEKANVPWVMLTSIAEQLYTPVAKTIWTTGMSASIESYAQVDHAIRSGKKRIGIIALQDAWGRGRYEPLMEYLKKNGITPVADVEIVDTANDATAQVLKLKQANPDAVMLLLYARSAAVYMRDAHKLGFKPYTIGTSATGDLVKLAEQVGFPEALDNMVSMSLVNHVPSDTEMDPWKVLLQKYYPGDEFQVNHIIGIGSGSAIVEVLQRVGKDLTRERFTEEMNKLTNWRTPIYAGPITCSVDDHRCNKYPGWVKLDVKTNKVISIKQQPN